MKIYVACPWLDKHIAAETAERLRAHGHTITHEWWKFEASDSDWAYLRRCAQWDVAGVLGADILLLLNTRMSEGKCFEQGMAVISGKPVLAVGTLGKETSNIFHHLEAYTWVLTVDEALVVLDGYKEAQL